MPLYSNLACKSILSLALEPTSSGFQHLLKTSGDFQPCDLSSFRILGLSNHRQPLLDQLNPSLYVIVINPLLYTIERFKKQTKNKKKERDSSYKFSYSRELQYSSLLSVSHMGARSYPKSFLCSDSFHGSPPPQFTSPCHGFYSPSSPFPCLSARFFPLLHPVKAASLFSAPCLFAWFTRVLGICPQHQIQLQVQVCTTRI